MGTPLLKYGLAGVAVAIASRPWSAFNPRETDLLAAVTSALPMLLTLIGISTAAIALWREVSRVSLDLRKARSAYPYPLPDDWLPTEWRRGATLIRLAVPEHELRMLWLGVLTEDQCGGHLQRDMYFRRVWLACPVSARQRFELAGVNPPEGIASVLTAQLRDKQAKNRRAPWTFEGHERE